MNGHPSEEPCRVCGAHDENMQEPRFLYVVCKLHYEVTPVEVNYLAEQREQRLERITSQGTIPLNVAQAIDTHISNSLEKFIIGMQNPRGIIAEEYYPVYRTLFMFYMRDNSQAGINDYMEDIKK